MSEQQWQFATDDEWPDYLTENADALIREIEKFGAGAAAHQWISTTDAPVATMSACRTEGGFHAVYVDHRDGSVVWASHEAVAS